MIPEKILSRIARCKSCGEEHAIVGTPGQTVVAEFTCPCGQRMKISTTFA